MVRRLLTASRNGAEPDMTAVGAGVVVGAKGRGIVRGGGGGWLLSGKGGGGVCCCCWILWLMEGGMEAFILPAKVEREEAFLIICRDAMCDVM